MEVASTLQLPLIANERCGSWYTPTSSEAALAPACTDAERAGGESGERRKSKNASKSHGSAYFKSTDGHFGQWGFSLRRLNWGVLRTVSDHGG